MRKINFFSSNDYLKTINMSSLNKKVASQRDHVYQQVMSNLNMVEKTARKLKMFSNISDIEATMSGITLSEVSIKAYINSIAGFVAIERPLSQIQDNIVYKDVVTKSGTNIAPFLGAWNPRNRADASHTSNITTGETNISIALNKLIAPKSLAIALKLNDNIYALSDDGNGNILAPGGIISAGTIDYATGDVEITLASAAPAKSSITIKYVEDKLSESDAEKASRAKIVTKYMPITANINTYEYEADLIASAIAEKSLGSDVITELKDSVYDEQLLAINNKLVDSIKLGYTGNTLKIDLSTFSISSGKFDSLLKVFNSGLVSINSALATKTYKTVSATAYLVGSGLSDLFGSFSEDQGWVPNYTGFVNGLVGFYKGLAVIRHLSLSSYEGFAIHKTPDAQMAPTALGIFLPATDLPLIGNYGKVNEVAGGIYSVDGAVLLTSDLTQRFTVTMPSDWMTVS